VAWQKPINYSFWSLHLDIIILQLKNDNVDEKTCEIQEFTDRDSRDLLFSLLTSVTHTRAHACTNTHTHTVTVMTTLYLSAQCFFTVWTARTWFPVRESTFFLPSIQKVSGAHLTYQTDSKSTFSGGGAAEARRSLTSIWGQHLDSMLLTRHASLHLLDVLLRYWGNLTSCSLTSTLHLILTFAGCVTAYMQSGGHASQ
jgi:hypothetical protein